MNLWNFCNVTNLYQLRKSFWLWELLFLQCRILYWDCVVNSFLGRQGFVISAVNFLKSSFPSSRKTLLRRGCRASIPYSIYARIPLYTSFLQYQYIAYTIRHQRARPERNYLMLGEFWNRKEKPKMIYFFLSTIYKRSCKAIYRRFWVESTRGKNISQCFVLGACADAVARCMMQKFIQFMELLAVHGAIQIENDCLVR
jgi:hypothetical protein